MSRDNQISVVYPCCGAQEYWPLTDRGELEMEHTELGAPCNGTTATYQEQMDDLKRRLAEAEARVERLQDAYLRAEDMLVGWCEENAESVRGRDNCQHHTEHEYRQGLHPDDLNNQRDRRGEGR